MLKKIRSIILLISKILFPISILIGVGIDAYYKFDVPEGVRGYNIALFAYFYFCFYLAVLLTRRIIKIQSWIIKLFKYLCLWSILILVFDVNGPTNEGILGSIDFVIVLIAFFTIILLTSYFLYIVFFKNLKKVIKKTFSSFFNVLSFVIITFIVVSLVVWFVLNSDEHIASTNQRPTPTFTPPPITLIQPWQLNSRYKINKIVKFLKVDLDKDGKEDLAAITSYDKLPDDVFYYAGFYDYNPATEKWDEFYGEELNILNYAAARDDIEPAKLADFIKTFTMMWNNEFTTLENIGDITGDGSPEIVFSSLLQGKYFDNYIIVAQAGKSHFRYKIFGDQNTMAVIVVEDGLMIEKYATEFNDVKDIYEWDSKNLRFKLIESQKTKVTTPETPKAIPGFDELSS